MLTWLDNQLNNSKHLTSPSNNLDSWESSFKKFKEQDSTIKKESIENINNSRKDILTKLFNKIYRKFNSGVEPIFFKATPATDNSGINIWTLSSDSIKISDNINITLGGTGAKTNSDLDFEIA